MKFVQLIVKKSLILLPPDTSDVKTKMQQIRFRPDVEHITDILTGLEAGAYS